VGARLERARRALTVGRVAHRSGLRRILAEVGVVGRREATRERARAFRCGLEELGTTFIKLGQLLSSRPDLLPDVYIEELSHLVDDVPPVPFPELEAIVRADFGDDAFVPRPGAARDRVHRADPSRPARHGA
jgi:ubiquinone biosynthesis protein